MVTDVIRVTKIFPKITTSLLKEFRGSISGDEPTRMGRGIMLIRNHRGEHVLRSMNENMLRQRIPTYCCKIGHIVECINNYEIRNSSSQEAHSLLLNEILTRIVTRPRRVTTRRVLAEIQVERHIWSGEDRNVSPRGLAPRHPKMSSCIASVVRGENSRNIGPDRSDFWLGEQARHWVLNDINCI